MAVEDVSRVESGNWVQSTEFEGTTEGASRIESGGRVQNSESEEAVVPPDWEPNYEEQDHGSESMKGELAFIGSMIEHKLRTEFEADARGVSFNVEESAEAVYARGGGSKPSVEKSIEAVYEAYGLGYAQGGARELAAQLRSGDEAFRTELIAKLVKDDSEASLRILRAAGGEPAPYEGDDRLSTSDSQIIARSLGAAYDRGKLGSDFAQRLVRAEAEYLNNTPGVLLDPPYNEYTGNLIAQSGSTRLMRDYAVSAIEHAAKAQTSNDLQMLNGAARAMSGDPKVLSEILTKLDAGALGDGKIGLESFLDVVNASPFAVERNHERIVGNGNPLATVLEAAARMPASEPKVKELKEKLFETVVNSDRLMEGAGVPDALVTLYRSDARFLTERLIDTKVNLEGLVTLSKFFEDTLYSPKCTKQEELLGTLKDLAKGFHDGNRPYELGLLAGGVANGFQLAVKEERDREAAVKGFVSFVFDLIPVGGKIKSVFENALGKDVGEFVGKIIAEKGVEAAKEDVAQYLTDRLTEETGLFGIGSGAKVKNRNDVDEILRGAFEISKFSQSQVERYNNGIGY